MAHTAPSAAAVTVARDEGAMMRRWVDHYGAQFGLERLIVFDDNSSDGSTDDLGCTVYRLPPTSPGARFGEFRTGLVNGIARALLNFHDVVVCTDVDEFLVADPARFDGLLDFLAARGDRPVCAPVAINVLPDSSSTALDLSRPVLGQRRVGKFVPRMCKPSIKRVPARWRTEGHAISAPFAVDPELLMFHMKFADRDRLREVGQRRNEAFRSDGRGHASSWRRQGDELADELDEIVRGLDADRLPELDPAGLDLRGVVVPKGEGVWATLPGSQLVATRTQPALRIPDRFTGTC